MSWALLGGLAGMVGSMVVIKRVRGFRMMYVDSGEYDVVVAVCDSSCIVDHTDVDGTVHRDISLRQYDIVLGGKVTVKSGRMFVMVPEVVGAV